MSNPAGQPPLAIAHEVTVRIGHHLVLAPASFELQPGECTVVTGPNGSGKSILAEIIAGVRTPSTGTMSWPGLCDDPDARAALVSFEMQERLIARERHEDMSAIMHGELDPGHTVAELIGEDSVGGGADAVLPLAERFGISHILSRGLRFLSTGEFRKALLAAALVRDPRLLLLDDPYDGLDAASRDELARLIDDLHSAERSLLLVVNRARDIPSCATRVIELRDGAVHRDEAMRPRADPSVRRADPSVRRADPSVRRAERPPREAASAPNTDATLHRPGRRCPPQEAIVSMRDVRVSYGPVAVLNAVDWTVCPNDRWMIVGPNGSGKSTLLSLITGDNPKGYGQEISLFGRRKGSGESVWEIKRRIGYVSGDLQFAYPLHATVRETLLSGFHDSVGLFDEPSGHEEEIAKEWAGRLGLADRLNTRLRELSFGLRRVVLVARAVVKTPRLLIADEPCQGLDDEHTAQVLELLEAIGAGETTLLYVTHDPAEQLRGLTHRLELTPGPEGSRAVTTAL